MAGRVPSDFSSSDLPTLHHYTSLEGTRAIIASNSLWLTDHAAMNDTSEFDYAERRLYALLRERRVATDPAVRFLAAMTVAGLRDRIGLFIASLTARSDDLGQWRSYADDGRGCAVELDAAFLEHDAGVAVRTVVYDVQVGDALLCAGISVLQEQYEDAPDDHATLMDYARRLAVSLFAIKHPGFADEREVRVSRMVVRDDAGAFLDPGGNRGLGASTPELPVFARGSKFGETRSMALPLERRDGSSAILGVELGPAMPDAVVEAATREFRRMGLRVTRSGLPYRS